MTKMSDLHIPTREELIATQPPRWLYKFILGIVLGLVIVNVVIAFL